MAADFKIASLNPEAPAGPPVDIIIPGGYYQRLYKAQEVSYENLRAAKFVLENVDLIFWGVRAFNEGGWCYTGRPESWYIKPRVEAPFPAHLVFAVYVNPRLRLYEHRAERADEDGSPYPADWENRYRGLVWSRIS